MYIHQRRDMYIHFNTVYSWVLLLLDSQSGLHPTATHCNILCVDTQHSVQSKSCVWVCCSVLRCVAVCCSVLQCVAVCCSVLQCVAVCCSVLQRVKEMWKWQYTLQLMMISSLCIIISIAAAGYARADYIPLQLTATNYNWHMISSWCIFISVAVVGGARAHWCRCQSTSGWF